ncbi:GntR family transcriptional regulator [Jannaschia sp.]|nr:GntR family transcriptional regulator [Jannaschia sp.]
MGATAKIQVQPEDQADRKRNVAWARFRECLLDGRLQVGSTLTQNELAEILDISLTPLRELLVLLEDCQLLEVKQRAGVTIAYPDLEFIRENLQFRAILEMSAIESFCLTVEQRWIDAQISLHQSILAGLSDRSTTIGRHTSEAFDHPFHAAIIDSLENKGISRTFQRVMDNVTLSQLVHRKSYTAEQISDTIDEHLRIIDRIDARDPTGAKAALRSHFSLSTHRIIGG